MRVHSLIDACDFLFQPVREMKAKLEVRLVYRNIVLNPLMISRTFGMLHSACEL